MRAGPAFLQFDWSKGSLSMDLPVFVYSHMKTSFRFLSRQRKYRKLFMWLQIFYFKQGKGNLTGLLFCLDFVCQGLLITKIVICIHYLIVSSPHAVRPATLSFAWVWTCMFLIWNHVRNVTRQERNQESSYRIGKCTCYFLLVARWPRLEMKEPVDVVWSMTMSDPATFQL